MNILEKINIESIILVSILFGAFISAIAFFLRSRLNKAKYDQDNKTVILEAIRESLESQIYSLNERLLINEERWKDVNHLLLRDEYLNNNSPLIKSREIHYSDFLKSNGIEKNDLLVDEKFIFLLTPFHDQFNTDYSLIRNVCSDLGYTCQRGDENYFKSDLFPEMLKLIVKANLVIANINGRNPNVMYELGIAQALDKPVILIANKPENLPIDIKSKRFLIYSSLDDLKTKLREELLNISQKSE